MMIENKISPQRKQYEYRKSNGLCPRCGKPLDREGFYCTECLKIRNQYNRENRDFFRQHNLCPVCGKVALFGNEKSCPECRAKNAEYKTNQYQSNPQHYVEYQKSRHRILYKQRADNGVCVRCGKRKPYPGAKMCEICREKSREQKRNKYIRKIPNRGADGTCYRCGKPIDDKRYKLCSQCVEQNRKNCKNIDRSQHYWRNLDRLIYKN